MDTELKIFLIGKIKTDIKIAVFFSNSVGSGGSFHLQNVDV